jgi:biopolymer transport protein ExbB
MAATALLAAMTNMAHAADAFSADDWKHHQKTVIDTSAEGVELKQGATQVPIALRLHTGNFGFAEAKPDGSDLRATSGDGKTPLKFHLEKFDPANELAVVWVQQPKLSPSAKSDAIALHWGKADAKAAGEAKGTYDAPQTLVLHFSDAGPLRDATGNGNHPREFAAKFVAGPLADAIRLDGNALLVPASPSLRMVAANGFTFTAWLKPADVSAGTLFEQADGKRSLALLLRNGRLAVSIDGRETATAATLQADAWQHVAATLAGGKLAIYVNGEALASIDAAPGDLGGDLRIGADLRADLDEVTLAAIARPVDYIKALHGSQQPDSLMLATADEEGAGESVSYMSILLSAVTLDGWIVIGILMVMAIVSFAVMIGKTRFLIIAKRANASFIERFRNHSEALLDPDTEESQRIATEPAFVQSPIYRLYTIGMHEMRQRFTARGRDAGLSAAALDAIRASMDAVLVRENQRLNSQIVLLTIAISGGPFLGLLGTVVGVMITFAAIAAAGDVNVNAIAPGIAAALVATVAGLAVAIPALFGYNWLASQIKNVSADTQVFADEFLTRAAELHSR